MTDLINSDSLKAYMDFFINENNPHATEYYVCDASFDDSFLDEEPITEQDVIRITAD